MSLGLVASAERLYHAANPVGTSTATVTSSELSAWLNIAQPLGIKQEPGAITRNASMKGRADVGTVQLQKNIEMNT